MVIRMLLGGMLLLLAFPTHGNAQVPSGSASSVRPTRVTSGPKELPNSHGQLWRQYDISPYTSRVSSTARPEQAIVDWILRDTGYEAWHGETFAILSVNSRFLSVYHTPEMQESVANVVDRFVASEAETHAFGVRVITVGHPNWRARAQKLLQPMKVENPATQAWLLAREDAAVLLAELRRRNDYREHSTPHRLVTNGQSTVVEAKRARNYVRQIVTSQHAPSGIESRTAVIDEGYSLELSPLMLVDGETIDAAIRCEIDQIEKMLPVMIDVPNPTVPRQRAEIEVPQRTQLRFHERFRWPADHVLLIGLGMVPLPTPSDGTSLVSSLPIPLPLSSSGPARGDLLILVEYRGKAGRTDRITEPTR